MKQGSGKNRTGATPPRTQVKQLTPAFASMIGVKHNHKPPPAKKGKTGGTAMNRATHAKGSQGEH